MQWTPHQFSSIFTVKSYDTYNSWCGMQVLGYPYCDWTWSDMSAISLDIPVGSTEAQTTSVTRTFSYSAGTANSNTPTFCATYYTISVSYVTAGHPSLTYSLDSANSLVTLSQVSSQTAIMGQSSQFTLSIADTRTSPAILTTVEGTAYYRASCTQNDLAGVTVTGTDGLALPNYSYYAYTEGEKIFSYAYSGVPTCAGYLSAESKIQIEVTGASGGVVQVGTDLQTYQNCVVQNQNACLYHDVAARQLYVNIYSTSMDGANTVMFRPVQVGYSGLAADAKNTRSYANANSFTFTLTVVPGSPSGYSPTLA